MNKVEQWRKKLDEYYENATSDNLTRDLRASGFPVVSTGMLQGLTPHMVADEVAATTEKALEDDPDWVEDETHALSIRIG